MSTLARSPISRRSIIATMMAALLPATGAVALPVNAAALPSNTETPELIALGAELEAKLETHRAATARLANARSVAAELWPAAPDELIVVTREDRDFYESCYERETDCEGEEIWPETYQVDGQLFGHFPRKILQSGSLSQFLAEIRAEPEHYEVWLQDLLIEQINAAKSYEAACAHAIQTSGIERAKLDAERAAQDLSNTAGRLRSHLPQTVAGVVVHARAIAGWAEVDREGCIHA
jgi:hypothetical protein